MKKNQYKQNYTERYNPEINSGLSDAQINERIANNLVNTSVKKHSKSYAKIFIDNFCTFFNFLGLIVAIALIFAKAEIQQFFFVLIYLANILIGIIFIYMFVFLVYLFQKWKSVGTEIQLCKLSFFLLFSGLFLFYPLLFYYAADIL